MRRNPLELAKIHCHEHAGNVYEISKAVIAVSALRNQGLYQSIRQQMIAAFNLASDSPEFSLEQFSENKEEKDIHLQTWLLGRLLLAAGAMNDTETANKVLPLMLELLKDETNPFRPWAKAYLVAYLADPANPEHSQLFDTHFKINQFVTFDKAKEGSAAEVIWERVLYLGAASVAKPDDYPGMLNAFMQAVDQLSIEGVFNLMRLDQTDFPAWATGYMAFVSATAKDAGMSEKLLVLLEQKMRDSKDDGDEMIALAYQQATLPLLEALKVAAVSSVPQPGL